MKRLMAIILLLITAPAFVGYVYAADQQHDGMTELRSCEDAAESNAKATYWLENQASQPPKNDVDYFFKINSSPWCYIVAVGGKHNTVYQYSAMGQAVPNGIIHKNGEEQWRKTNWSKIRLMCTVPVDIYNGTPAHRSYRYPTSAKACLIFLAPNSIGTKLHSEGIGKARGGAQQY